MATALPNANINIPYSQFLDDNTGRPSQAWLQWLMNPSVISLSTGSAIGVTSGGTGITAIPTNGQLLIGNGTGYTLNTLGFGAGISVTNGSGTITVANTGVLSNIAGTGISVSSATGNVTVSNTGVLSFSAGTTGLTPSAATTGAISLAGTLIAVNGGTGFSSYAVGDLLYANTTTTLAKLPDVATGNALISGGVNTAPSWGKIGLTTHVSGLLPVANGGTGVATATANTIFAGPTSGVAAAPSFRALVAADIPALTTGSSILYGNGTGAFSNVTIGSGISFAGGTLSATGSGGTVTSVTGTAPVVSSGGTTPAISMAVATSSVNGYLSSTDWSTFNNKQAVSAPVTKTADFTVAATDLWLINNKSGSTCTVTLPAASSYTGRVLHFQNYLSQTLVSASSNVVPIAGGSAGTSILVASSGDQATLVSDGTNWLMTQYIPNNILLLET
jgi:hypothetical protein